VLALAAQYGVLNVRVFGSMARDDANDASDIDLLVDAPPGTSGFTLGALLMDLQDVFGRRVDVVTENALHPAIRQRVRWQSEGNVDRARIGTPSNSIQ
jgi:predicted nucleotidyltransferase